MNPKVLGAKYPAPERAPGCALVPVLVALLACSGPCRAQDPGAAATICAHQATMVQRINLTSGVYTRRAVVSSPLYVTIPMGIDSGHYTDCLSHHGIRSETAAAAYFKRAADCRALATAPPTVHISAHGARLAGNVDEAAYRSCARGGSITVEATLPK